MSLPNGSAWDGGCGGTLGSLFIMLLGGAAVWTLSARAQPDDRVRRIGVLMNGRSTETVPQALRQPGWTEGQKSAH